MERASIVDVTSLNKDGILIAHMPKVAYNYYRVLSLKYSASIIGGSPYRNQYADLNVVELPYDTPSVSNASFVNRLKVKIHEVINTKCALKSQSSILIFQSYSRLTPILLGLLFGRCKGKKVFLIQYFTSPRISYASKIFEEILLGLDKNRISGIICTNKKVSERFNMPNIIVPDYFYFEDDYQTQKSEIADYDFGIFGQIGKGKKVEEVISAFAGRAEKILIAGRFSSEERFEKCQNAATKNITIINRYLTDDEYNDYFARCKSIILPYASGYNEHSSGVVLDALFHKKPVLGTKVGAFEFVSTYKMGYLYQEDLSAAIDEFNTSYESYRTNIELYLKRHEVYKKELLDFLDRERLHD